MTPDGAPALETRLIHAESGEQITSHMPLVLTKQDPQSQGSALTYARRYALLAILGLVGDEDDDASRAQSPDPAYQEARADNGVPIAQTIIPFGKHKGEYLGSAPTSYWEWWLASDHAAKPDLQEFRAKVELHLGLTGVAPGAPDDLLDDIPFQASEF
jgi:uncharacterized protein (DUF3820 family)